MSILSVDYAISVIESLHKAEFEKWDFTDSQIQKRLYALNMAKAALLKQKRNKPKYTRLGHPHCPFCCTALFGQYYCPHCGQHIEYEKDTIHR